MTTVDPPERRLYDELPDGLVVADSEGLVTYVNPVAVELLGAPSGADLVGRPLAEAMPLTDLDGHRWTDCVDPYAGLRWRRRVFESSWRTETDLEVLVTASLVRTSPGGPVERLLVSLRHARARERVERQRSDLVATVAHELRSPLTGVKGFTSTLLSKWDRLNDLQRKMMLETVDADADRLTRLIGELLDAARIDSGRLRLRREPTDLGSLVTAQVETLRSTTSRHIEVVAPSPDDAPTTWLDADKVAQVVANLVENALMHGDGTITVSVVADDDGVQLLVDDEGPGIGSAIRPWVFTKFWTKAQRDGSGLGLYIARGMVEAHDGTIEVATAPGGGARLACWFPTGEPEVVQAP